MTVYLNADRSKVVPEGSPDAAFGVAEADVAALGLTDALAKFNVEQAEDYARRNTEPEVKAVAAPANKAVKKPNDK